MGTSGRSGREDHEDEGWKHAFGTQGRARRGHGDGRGPRIDTAGRERGRHDDN